MSRRFFEGLADLLDLGLRNDRNQRGTLGAPRCPDTIGQGDTDFRQRARLPPEKGDCDIKEGTLTNQRCNRFPTHYRAANRSGLLRPRDLIDLHLQPCSNASRSRSSWDCRAVLRPRFRLSPLEIFANKCNRCISGDVVPDIVGNEWVVNEDVARQPAPMVSNRISLSIASTVFIGGPKPLVGVQRQ